MKRVILLLGLMIVGTAAAVAQPSSSTPPPVPAPKPTPSPAATPAPLKLKVGDVAPDFTLSDTKGNKIKLSDFRGKSNVVLAFYVFAFTGG